jgi:hypothetical protein
MSAVERAFKLTCLTASGHLNYVPKGKEIVCEDVKLTWTVSEENSLVDILGNEWIVGHVRVHYIMSTCSCIDYSGNVLENAVPWLSKIEG